MAHLEHSITALQPGALISSPTDTYEIVAELGRGGMGVVYEASQQSVGRTVALKTLNLSGEHSAQSMQRLRREAKLCATLDHPNIVKVYALHTDEHGQPFIVMEYLRGTTLAEMLRERGTLDKSTFVELFAQLLEGLKYAHEKGLIHRDIKPSNIMVTADGTAKLMDFGIAKDTMGVAGTPQGLTQTGALIGSPWYMSPEQCSGQPVDPRSDLYSLGCVMYECLSGKPPFGGESAFEVMLKQLHDQIATGNELKLPEFADVVCTAMDKNPDQRFANAEEMWFALQKSSTQVAGKPKRARSSSRRSASNSKNWLVISAVGICIPLAAIGVHSLMQQKSGDAESQAPAKLTGRQLINAGRELLAKSNTQGTISPALRAADQLTATRYFQTAVLRARQEDKNFDEAEAFYNLAALTEGSNPQKAIELMEESVRLYAKVRRNSSEHATALSNLCHYYASTKQWGKLKTATDELISMNSYGDMFGRSTRLYSAQFDLARAYFGLGRDAQGAKLLAEAKANAAKLDDRQLTLSINRFIADRLVQKQNYAEAIKQMKQNLEFIDSAKEDTRPLVTARQQEMIALAEAYFITQRYPEFLELGKRLEPLLKATDPTSFDAQSLLRHRIGIAYEVLKQPDKAIDAFEESAALARKGMAYNPKSEHVLMPLNLLFHQRLMADPYKALSVAKEMDKHAERTREIHKIGSQTNIGMANIRLKRVNEAYAAFLKVEALLPTYVAQIPIDQQIIFLRHMAYVECALNKRSAAADHFKKLEALCRDNRARPDLVQVVKLNHAQFERGEEISL